MGALLSDALPVPAFATCQRRAGLCLPGQLARAACQSRLPEQDAVGIASCPSLAREGAHGR